MRESCRTYLSVNVGRRTVQNEVACRLILRFFSEIC